MAGYCRYVTYLPENLVIDRRRYRSISSRPNDMAVLPASLAYSGGPRDGLLLRRACNAQAQGRHDGSYARQAGGSANRQSQADQG
jgi:hypothetical protein